MRGEHTGGPIQWRLHVPRRPDEVFEALTTDEGRASFWAESAVEQDGVIAFRFINGEAYDARIVERRHPDLFSLEYFGGLARFELTNDGRGGTDLLLTHTGIRDDEWIEVHAGWLNVLFPLKAWLVASVDLRNHDVTRTWDHGYADQ